MLECKFPVWREVNREGKKGVGEISLEYMDFEVSWRPQAVVSNRQLAKV